MQQQYRYDKRTSKARKLSLNRARGTFQEGVALLEKGFCTGAVNRFYYAAFYAARALLATKELDSSKHRGVIALFHEHFVRTDLVNSEIAKTLSRSFEQRQDFDYEDFISATTEDAESVRERVKQFMNECEMAFRKIKNQ